MSKAKAFKRMAELGATYDSECMILDAPKGYVFAETRLHCVVAPTWAHALEDMEAGIMECTVEDCEFCE